jgi:aryl-alcohol dehydrogenase-like predicted oxidoreductase
MEHRRLGLSGLMISAITYGNWITHGSQIEEDAAAACVRRALDLGITTFDTADIYAQGRAEEVLGRALKGERRDGLEIFTKVFWPMGSGPNDRGLSRKHVIEGCHASLRRLGTDHIDLYQAHRFDFQTPLEETLRAFDDLVRQGKVLYVGISEWTAEQIAQAVEIADAMGYDRIISSQPQYNLLWRITEEKVVPTSIELGIGQIVWSPIAGGVLSGKYLPGAAPPEGSRGADEKSAMFVRGMLERTEVLEAVQRLRPIADELGITLAQLALAWVLARPGVSAALVGATRPEQLVENVAALDVSLDDDVLARIDAALGEDVIERDPERTLQMSPNPRP